MKVESGKVVLFHYKSTDEHGEIVENSFEGDPMAYLIGSKGIMPALEDAMLGHEIDEVIEFQVPPHKAYGMRREDAVQRVSIKHLIEPPRKLVKGQIVRLNTSKGPREMTVIKAGRFNIDVDTNHPLAGQSIDFSLKVVDIRNATGAEMAHGHAHGHDGHADH